MAQGGKGVCLAPESQQVRTKEIFSLSQNFRTTVEKVSTLNFSLQRQLDKGSKYDLQ